MCCGASTGFADTVRSRRGCCGSSVTPPSIWAGSDDAGIIWWDPEAEGEDEVGNDGVGMYRYANGGQRYLLGEFPESLEEAGLFDVPSSVTVYEEIPEEDRTPDYPPPGG